MALSTHDIPNRLGGVQDYGRDGGKVLPSVWYLQTLVALSTHGIPNRFGGVQDYGKGDGKVLPSVWYLQSLVALSTRETPNRLGGVQDHGKDDGKVLQIAAKSEKPTRTNSGKKWFLTPPEKSINNRNSEPE